MARDRMGRYAHYDFDKRDYTIGKETGKCVLGTKFWLLAKYHEFRVLKCFLLPIQLLYPISPLQFTSPLAMN